MAKFISLIRFTEQGAKAMKKSTARAKEFDRMAEKAGVKIVEQYWTLGKYDGVLIIEAADPKKALHCLAELGEGGNVKTMTMQAFDAAEFDSIVAG